MFNKIKQLKNLRDQASQMKEMLAQEMINASAASGKVSLVMNGNQEVLAIEISEELLESNKKEELEKALKEAFNEAVKKVQRVIAQKLQSSGISLPGL